MNILLVSPRTPSTFWSFRYALKFISKKSSEPPLGLLTVAALLPEDWHLKLIDLNVQPLKENDLRWADYLFLGGMNINVQSMRQVIRQAKQIGLPVVVGGPLATIDRQLLEDVDYFVLNEAEITLPRFLDDLQKGHPQKIYSTQAFPDLRQSPVPRWELLQMDQYSDMSMQFSRGCPYDCDFCNVTLLNGHRPRTKSAEQFLKELQTIYDLGWRGSVFIVDDNFIGNRRVVKHEILPAVIEWQKAHDRPFTFITQASVNLADDESLMDLMVHAGFDSVFVGIETPNEASLSESNKKQNERRDLLTAVKNMQKHGLVVSGGFIVGFDHDPPEIFSIQEKFIQRSGIITAMVGLLNAPTGTRLYKRLKAEGRLLRTMSGDNMDGDTNFIPKMDFQFLKSSYRQLVDRLYEPKEFYTRLKIFLRDYCLPEWAGRGRISFNDIKAFLKTLLILGLWEKGRLQYWKVLGYTLLKFPQKFPLAVRLSVYGYHFRRIARGLA